MAVTTADAEEQRFVEALSEARPHVLGAFGRLGAAPHDIEDLVQEVFARAWRYRKSFDGRGPVAAWLSGIAARVWTDHCRRGGKAPEGLDADQRGAPDRNARDLEAREQIVRALERLTPIQRDVLLAFHRDGASLAEIAHRKNMSVNTVKSHLHRARRVLGEGLA
jgi:RNA polymerase sigma-70 factor (ECF subfamily)